jgi:MFS superfamily sulfate permease-like transporter
MGLARLVPIAATPRPSPHPPRNIEQYPQSELTPGVLVVRLDAPVYFANAQYMRDKLDDYEAEAQA